MTSRALWVLCQNRHFDVCDDRDRIYALTGMMDTVAAYDLASDAEKRRQRLQRFPVDYVLSPSAIYQSFTKFLIQTEENLNCLEVFGDRPQQGDVPSWSTDWREESFYNSFEAYSIPKMYQDTLSLNHPSENPSDYMMPLRAEDWLPMPHVGTNELHLHGHRLGSIRRSQVLELDSYAFRYFDEWRVDKEYDYVDTIMTNHASTTRGMLNECLEQQFLILLSMNTIETEDTASQQSERSSDEEELLCGVLVSPSVQDGDIVVLLVGSRMIHVIRPNGRQRFSLVCAGWLWREAFSNERSKYPGRNASYL